MLFVVFPIYFPPYPILHQNSEPVFPICHEIAFINHCQGTLPTIPPFSVLFPVPCIPISCLLVLVDSPTVSSIVFPLSIVHKSIFSCSHPKKCLFPIIHEPIIVGSIFLFLALECQRVHSFRIFI